MKLETAKDVLADVAGVPFKDLFTPEEMEDLRTDKGIVGKLLERKLGLAHSSRVLDFEDGELKTNKCHRGGRPRETMYITQVSTTIDDILNEKPFESTRLCKKTRRILYVPVCKEGEEPNWMFLPAVDVDLTAPPYASVAQQIREDYYSIARQLRLHIETSDDGYIHTSNGTLIQVRSKDAKPYNAIYSQKYSRNVSNKNHAFYFMKSFMIRIQQMSPEYPFEA